MITTQPQQHTLVDRGMSIQRIGLEWTLQSPPRQIRASIGFFISTYSLISTPWLTLPWKAPQLSSAIYLVGRN